MNPSRYRSLSSKARFAGALLALVFSVVCLGAVIAVFAQATGELDPVMAVVKSSPAASTVASKGPGKSRRG